MREYRIARNEAPVEYGVGLFRRFDTGASAAYDTAVRFGRRLRPRADKVGIIRQVGMALPQIREQRKAVIR